VSANVTWHPGLVSREERWTALGTSGATVWFTGLPSSGKSSLAVAVESRLLESGDAAYVLDGDNLRHGLNANLGFDKASRSENVRRAAEAARLFADAGLVALVSLVSPYAADREAARRVHEQSGIPFIEVFVNTPIEECARRDPKGLYARARGGELRGFTGVDDPYEPPQSPELELLPGTELETAVDQVVVLLKKPVTGAVDAAGLRLAAEKMGYNALTRSRVRSCTTNPGPIRDS
jgi:adenylyl-sulfate kinase